MKTSHYGRPEPGLLSRFGSDRADERGGAAAALHLRAGSRMARGWDLCLVRQGGMYRKRGTADLGEIQRNTVVDAHWTVLDVKMEYDIIMLFFAFLS